MKYTKKNTLETIVTYKDYKYWLKYCPAYFKLIKRDAKIKFEDMKFNKRVNKALNREIRNWELTKHYRHESMFYNPIQRYIRSKHYQRYWKNREWKGIE